MTIQELNNRLDSILKEVPDKEFDKICLLEDLCGVTREMLATHPEKELTEAAANSAVKGARRRAAGYPLQYILGKWEFYGRDFKVGEGVLIPRPDTETLIDEILSRLEKSDPHGILDLCSGSGCIAVTLAKELSGSRVYAVELSSEAFPYLVENVRANGADVKLLKGDVMNGALLENFRDTEGEYLPIDCIVSNPPYLTDKEMDELQKEVTFEPEMALYGGSDGLKFYRVIACLWKELLKKDGLMIFETGTEQADEVKKILAESGFTDTFTANDATGGVRVVGGYLRD
ncbi:MAG: peptide chain release factor N(5)-glutamine methyltransferase [Oscillospiraceae bacterium]|nr:peptide chain release factor N(5)-glutamine methyltransferase [Oscillospiraceae bacterium]